MTTLLNAGTFDANAEFVGELGTVLVVTLLGFVNETVLTIVLSTTGDADDDVAPGVGLESLVSMVTLLEIVLLVVVVVLVVDMT